MALKIMPHGRLQEWAFGTGERIVFLPYTREVFAATQDWTEAHQMFSERPESLLGYDEAALV
jgi:NitT/TauT family transport system substrate-binding protein